MHVSIDYHGARRVFHGGKYQKHGLQVMRRPSRSSYTVGGKRYTNTARAENPYITGAVGKARWFAALPATLRRLLDAKGQFPAYTWPGGYTIIYWYPEGVAMCADCTNIAHKHDWSVPVGADNAGEMEELTLCENCGAVLVEGEPYHEDDFSTSYTDEEADAALTAFEHKTAYLRTQGFTDADLDDLYIP